MVQSKINRRNFIERLGASGLAVPLGLTACGPGKPSTETSTGKVQAAGGPKAGLCTICFQERPFEEVLELTARVGFDGVEPWGKPDHLPLTRTDDQVKAVRDKLLSLGLGVSQYGSYLRLGDGQEPSEKDKDMDRLIRITTLLGAKIARIWAGTRDSEQLDERDWEAMVADGKRFCKRAEDSGILLALEMHTRSVTNRAATMVDLIQRVGSPALKANYQAIFGPAGEDFYERARIAGPYVVNVHAQNNKAGMGECLISEGDLDFKRLYEILKGFGFDGYFEVEFVKSGTYEEKLAALQADCAFLKSIGS